MGVITDQPISKPEDDVLERARFARSFAKQVLEIDRGEGIVVGVLGPWGSGKTSFINLARLRWEEVGVKVLDFNPWMFSGAEQLVERFFFELSAQMRLLPGLAGIGRLLGKFGSGLVGLLPPSPWTVLVQWLLRTLASIGRKEPAKILLDRRTKIEKALTKLDKPIVVVLDDIDRLTTSEIRDIFKLVRLTANFPNIIYVLAFDRERVEKALNEQNIPGRDYLEKILQIGFDLPTVSAQTLSGQIVGAINNALSDIDDQGPFDERDWTDVCIEVIRPLIRNMRDVHRYAAAIHGTVRDLGGQVALVDVLALEAIRVFLPDVFRLVHKSVDGLTTTSYDSAHLSGQLKEQVDRLIEAAVDAEAEVDHTGVVRALVERLFPGGQRHLGGMQVHYGNESKSRWLRERRVAHEDVLRLYLERVVGEGLQAFTEAEQAWARMANREAFDTYLRSLDLERLQDVISSLEVYEDQFSHEHVVPGAVVLLNLLPELPERSRGGLFDLEGWLIVGRVVYRLVRSLKSQGGIEEAIREILPQVTTLSSKLELITTGQAHKLISESAVCALKEDWRTQVRSTPTEDLAKEHRLFWLLFRYKKEADPAEPLFEIPDSPSVTLALLESACNEARSQSHRSRFIDRSSHLEWDGLIKLYGDESTLRERIEALKASQPEGSDELLLLADKYLGGWRPRDMDED